MVVMLVSVVGGVFIVFALMALCYRSVVVHRNLSLCLRLVESFHHARVRFCCVDALSLSLSLSLFDALAIYAPLKKKTKKKSSLHSVFNHDPILPPSSRNNSLLFRYYFVFPFPSLVKDSYTTRSK